MSQSSQDVSRIGGVRAAQRDFFGVRFLRIHSLASAAPRRV
jgi:hypothetical protein